MKALPRVSIIVPTYNEEDNIEKCLRSITSQSYPNIELIVVDSLRTSDSTAKIAKGFTKKVYKYGKERSPQRNYGANKTNGKYLLFLDADMGLEEEVVEECVKVIEGDKKIKALIIPEKSFGESYWAKCKALERNCYIGDETIEAPRFFDKTLFGELGGFNPKMISGEDWDLGVRVKKAGGGVGRINSLIHHNEGALSLIKSLKKKLYYSQKADEYISANVAGVKEIILFIFRPAYFRNWKSLVSDPVHFPGFVIMKLLEFGVGGFGAILYKRSFWKKLF